MKKQKLLKIINEKVPCKKGCSECCGIVPFTKSEFDAIPIHLKENIEITKMGEDHYVPVNGKDLKCPFLKQNDSGNKQCSIYEYRPFICKAFGRLEKLTCPFGANGKKLIKSKDIAKLMPLDLKLDKEEEKSLSILLGKFDDFGIKRI